MDECLVWQERPEPAVALLKLDHPPLNLMSDAMVTALGTRVERLRDDASVRVVVLTGAGERAFCAGADVREFPREAGMGRERARQRQALYQMVEFLPQPTVAALNGAAFGAGLELAMACDLRVAADDVSLGLPELKLGIFPAGGGTQRLPRLVGEARAKELIFLSRVVEANEAYAMGLVTHVARRANLQVFAMDLARRLAGQPAAALQAAKQAIRVGIWCGPDAGYEAEAELADAVFLSPDAREGVTAFLEKRKPNFYHPLQ